MRWKQRHTFAGFTCLSQLTLSTPHHEASVRPEHAPCSAIDRQTVGPHDITRHQLDALLSVHVGALDPGSRSAVRPKHEPERRRIRISCTTGLHVHGSQFIVSGDKCDTLTARERQSRAVIPRSSRTTRSADDHRVTSLRRVSCPSRSSRDSWQLRRWRVPLEFRRRNSRSAPRLNRSSENGK